MQANKNNPGLPYLQAGDFLLRVITLACAQGMTRLAEVTGFDRLGMPVFQAVRPQALSLSVSQGKGRGRRQARISACMEALELAAAEQVGATESAAPTAPTRHLWNRHLPADALLAETPIAWIAATDMLAGKACPVPLGLVSMDMTRPQPMRPISTGLAGHATREAAVLTALCEIRDRWALWRFAEMSPLERRAAEVDPSSLDTRAMRWAVTRIGRGGAQLRLWEISPGMPWPAWVAAIVEAGGEQMVAPTIGACCRSTSAAAAFGAISEAAQSRVTLLAGARDDITRQDYDDITDRVAGFLLGSLSLRPATRAATADPPNAESAGLQELLQLLQAEGAAAVAVADIAPADWGIPFVKAIAPGVPDGERDLQ